MIERQKVDEWAEAQCLGALRQRRKDQPRRSGAAERRRMVLGKMIAGDAAAIGGFDQVEAGGIKLAERAARIVHVVEHAEFHEESPRRQAPSTWLGRENR